MNLDEFDFDVSVGDLSLTEAIAIANEAPGADTITFDSSLAGGSIDLGLALSVSTTAYGASRRGEVAAAFACLQSTTVMPAR